ncbi:MAG: hypothetical protein RSB71_00100 [Bacilli bacterium]
MNFLPNIKAPTFTISAVAVGLLLIDDLTPAEQNSVGNWFMMIGQTLCTNASQQQVINNFNKTSNASNSHLINNNLNDNDSQIIMMQKVINSLQQEMSILKKKG